MSTKNGLLAFRYMLPVFSLVTYVVLLQTATGPALPPNVGFDPSEPLPHKIARVVMGPPAYILALTLREWLSDYSPLFFNCCTGLFGVALWYGIGYWIDCELGLLPKPAPRKSIRLGSACLLAMLVVYVAASWVYVMATRPPFLETHLLEISGQLAWAIVLALILARIMAYNGRSTPVHAG